MTRLSPMDINSRMFKISFRGFDTNEVENFLGLVAEELETVTAENRMLKERMSVLEEEAAKLRDGEEQVRRRMEEASAFRNKMISEARLAADDILSAAQTRADQLEATIELLKREKNSLETYFKSFLKFNIELLRSWEQEPRE